MLIDPKLVGKRTKLNLKVIRTSSCSVNAPSKRMVAWANCAILRPVTADGPRASISGKVLRRKESELVARHLPWGTVGVRSTVASVCDTRI